MHKRLQWVLIVVALLLFAFACIRIGTSSYENAVREQLKQNKNTADGCLPCFLVDEGRALPVL